MPDLYSSHERDLVYTITLVKPLHNTQTHSSCQDALSFLSIEYCNHHFLQRFLAFVLFAVVPVRIAPCPLHSHLTSKQCARWPPAHNPAGSHHAPKNCGPCLIAAEIMRVGKGFVLPRRTPVAADGAAGIFSCCRCWRADRRAH